MLAVGAKGLPRASRDGPEEHNAGDEDEASPPRKQGWTLFELAHLRVREVSPSQAKMDPERSHRRSSSSIKFLGLGGRNGGMTPSTLAIPGYTTTPRSVVRS